MDKLIFAALTVAVASAARAQCSPPLNSNEARLLAFYEAPVVFAPVAAPTILEPGHIGITGELTTVPAAPRSLDHTHYCYTQSTESAHLSPVLPRLRVSVGLPAGFAIEGSYEPRALVLTLDHAERDNSGSGARDIRFRRRADHMSRGGSPAIECRGALLEPQGVG
jgi:hypothetical protein